MGNIQLQYSGEMIYTPSPIYCGGEYGFFDNVDLENLYFEDLVMMANRIGLAKKVKFFYISEENEVKGLLDDFELTEVCREALAEDRRMELYALEIQVEEEHGTEGDEGNDLNDDGHISHTEDNDDEDNDADVDESDEDNKDWSDKDSEYNSEYDDQDYEENVDESEVTWSGENGYSEGPASVVQSTIKKTLVAKYQKSAAWSKDICDTKGHNVRSCKAKPKGDLHAASKNGAGENLSTEMHVSDGLHCTEVHLDAHVSSREGCLDSLADVHVEVCEDIGLEKETEVGFNKHVADILRDNIEQLKPEYSDEQHRPMIHMRCNPPKRSNKATREKVPVFVIQRETGNLPGQSDVEKNPPLKTKKRKFKAASSSQPEKKVCKSEKGRIQRTSSSQPPFKLVDENIDKDPTTNNIHSKSSFVEAFGHVAAPSSTPKPPESVNDKKIVADALATFEQLMSTMDNLMPDVLQVKSSKALYDFYQGSYHDTVKSSRFDGNFITKLLRDLLQIIQQRRMGRSHMSSDM
ncbi:OLC1v1010023C1 [Oldenlandia corymbosa var. corymbosa]|uniref:OLC1v1010023C1 n=1 Tax=Oldenlandia corymbosa var. corymbosa TaxID=529605 RepID=A0AAV1DQD2_OLDCO|nr:OLC1v1010023C1 [Oldenlandia corymbosa var. corymbosa]